MIWPTDILSVETWILIGTVLILIRYYLHRKWSVLKKWGIQHEPPTVLGMGNLLDSVTKRPFTIGLECKKKFGPIYGIYAGTAPSIVVHDIEILRQIYIKDFANFPSREVRPVKLAGKALNTAVSSAVGARWKRIRSTMTPSFSTSKLKYMTSLMEWCCDNTVELLRKKNETGDGTFNAKRLFSCLSLDIILSAAFSTKVHSQDDSKEEPEISKQAKKLFEFSFFSPLVFLMIMFPPFSKLLEKMDFTLVKRSALDYFSQMTNILMQRKNENPHDMNQVDLLQLLMKSEISEEDLKNKPEKGMTKTEIIGNSMAMILAGYENTANAMGFLSYNLAFHPDIQRQVQDEIDNMMRTHGKFDYEGINELKFLDMCLNETLRLYTPLISNARGSVNEITINGLTIPPKVSVSIPTYALAHDPEYWDEPHEFRPERMRDMSQIDPMVFQPFGAGPRNCIGSRFALLEIKMAISKILYEFNFEPAADTPKPPLELVAIPAVRPKKPFDLRAVPRETAAEKI